MDENIPVASVPGRLPHLGRTQDDSSYRVVARTNRCLKPSYDSGLQRDLHLSPDAASLDDGSVSHHLKQPELPSASSSSSLQRLSVKANLGTRELPTIKKRSHRGSTFVKKSATETKLLFSLHNKPRKTPTFSITGLVKPLRQCLGIGCRKTVTNLSTKYCSKYCGMTVALSRLAKFLPAAKRSWEAGSQHLAADCVDSLRLNQVRAEQCELHKRIMEAEEQHRQLDALIKTAQEARLTVSAHDMKRAELEDLAEAESTDPVVCVTCSSEVNMRHILRHMEKCFQKMESNTIFCSTRKELRKGTPLFCDSFDTHAKAYCKRLHAVCEHVKDPKRPSDCVCGFPLVDESFVETGHFCVNFRSKCTRHFGWERKRRAKIDIERYRLLIRLDELLYEEARLCTALSQRSGLIGMLLHQTEPAK